MFKKLLLAINCLAILICGGCKKAKETQPVAIAPFYINVGWNSDTAFTLYGRWYKVYLCKDIADGRCAEHDCSCPGGGYWCDSKTYIYNAAGATIKTNTEIRGCMLYDSLSFIDPLYDVDTSFCFSIQQVTVLPYPKDTINWNFSNYVATYLIYPR